MQAAKDAVKKFTSKDGQHDTTVHERVAPGVTNETVTRQQEDRVTTAVDKEVHQDHYHTSVQPVNHSEALPEKHHHNVVRVEHRNFEHDSPDKVKQTLAAEAAKHKDTHQRVEGQHTTTAQPTVGAEHVHHHVHETIQPVVNKQTVEPHVVHTTVPIHEVHHNAAQHHAGSALPAMSMEEFKKSGGSLTGRSERSDKFDGCPTTGNVDAHGHNHSKHSHDTTGSGLTGNRNQDLPESLIGHSSGSKTAGSVGGVGGTSSGLDSSTSNTSSTNSKPSMLDKLNPSKDADGDGKKGFMS